ncbi:S53 family peptidase [Kutzneria kofuensis]|uniref:Subtilase family serine protease n=1 Tax=Kutzneria kofuensis TaxID=103725 RepID=A0A7W9NEU8_9PSEU|nr:protease pro-enzyme activation domain-containing protein [Kutzneria kofuensis]MBB5890737.1 subtilase family serine protease [Kutzneria kofuensis]
MSDTDAGRSSAGSPWRRRLQAATIAAVSLTVVATPLASAQTTQAGLVPQAVGKVPAIPHGAVAAAAPASDAKLNLSVALAPRDQAALDAFVQQVSDPKSPQYKHYLGKGQFGGVFGATKQTIDAVTKALKDAGLNPGPATPDGLSIPVTATAAEVHSALGVDFAGYKLSDGRTTFANTSAPKLPASVASSVTGVLGLNNLVKVAPSHTKPQGPAHAAANPSATRPNTVTPGLCQDVAQAAAGAGWTDTQTFWQPGSLSQSYGYNTAQLYTQYGDNGNGVTVALFELEDFDWQDIVDFQRCMNAHANVNKIVVNPQKPPTRPVVHTDDDQTGLESALDIEYVNGIAPGATVNVYQGPDWQDATSADATAVYQRMVNDDTAQVISTSWGTCEYNVQAFDPGRITAEKAIFQQAAAQGQTVLAAAGDTGSSDCYHGTGSTNGSVLSVDDPAGQPYVTAVGGTRMFGTNGVETVWNTGNGATGGGVSAVQSLSGAGNYQANVSGPGYSCARTDGSTCRQVPDVAALASADTRYLVSFGEFTPPGQTQPETDWWLVGGTSGATPVWAAIIALANSSHACAATGPVGFANPALYAAPQGTFRDVTTGNNFMSVSGNTSGLYNAGVGYDLTTGLGTPRAPQVVEAVCNAKAGPAGSAYTPVAPARLMDTRTDGTTLHSNGTRQLKVAGLGGVPATGATAVVLNVTVTNPSASSFLTVYPDGQPRPISSNLNYTAGVTVPNLVTVRVGDNGIVDFYNLSGNVDVVADVFGYYSTDGASLYKAAGPARLMDTRDNGGAIGEGQTRTLPIEGAAGIPASGVTAVVLNVTATNPNAGSFLTVYPGGTAAPQSSNLNYSPGQTIANLVTVPVGTDGSVAFLNHYGSVDVIADVFGYYTNSGDGLHFHPTAPARLADSRTGAGLINNNGVPIGPGAVTQVAIQNVNGAAGNNGPLGTAGALALNVTATNPTASSFITVYGSSMQRPSSSNLNFTPGLTIPNSVVVPTNGGAINLYNFQGSVDVVVDLFGYFA